jgi:SAM-dependent methyltransferase
LTTESPDPAGRRPLVHVLDRLEARACPVCGRSADDARSFLEDSIDPAELTGFSYASRKTPEYMSFRLVTCVSCRTVFAVTAPSAEALTQAYREAAYDSSEEARLAADTYVAALAAPLASLTMRQRALEIGAGTGVFLSRLTGAGFADVVGVEPSRAAIEAAEPLIRPMLREGVFVEGDFEPGSFDLICCFQTMEHVSAPRALAESCRRLLRPGGLLSLVTHDYRAPINRLLGRRSPIIDVAHLQLYCRSSLTELLRLVGLELIDIRSIKNTYPLDYWVRLSPLPRPLKARLQAALTVTGAGAWKLGVGVGNLMTIGRKPADVGLRAPGG